MRCDGPASGFPEPLPASIDIRVERGSNVNTPAKSVNAWILPFEDEPPSVGYSTPGSSYQNLIQYGVYNYLDMLNICFVNTVPTSSTTVPAGDGSSYTIELQTASHPGGVTNQQYMDWIIRDSRNVNPGLKILATLGYAGNEFTQIFSGPQSGWPAQAASYASNVVAYLKYYNLDGFDIDWESPFSDDTPTVQMSYVLQALRTAFDAAPRTYYLTLSPATADNLDGSVVNSTVDFVNLQLYSGFTCPEQFLNIDVSKQILAYGAKFEPNGGVPFETAQQAAAFWVQPDQCQTSLTYSIFTQWRLNSGNFQYEQAQQMILYQLIYGIPGPSFDDTPIMGAAGNPLISQVVVRSGEVLDAVQATSSGTYEGNPVSYTLLLHGGSGGTASTVSVPPGDSIAEVSGYTGVWFGWNCVLQLTIKTRGGKVFGPFGTMAHATSKTAFAYTAPSGQSIVAFRGSTVEVPIAGGGTTYIVQSLNVSCA